ncbi:hypothetical protein SASPL_123601 [Salvia splendens]|uniref:Uncharacterized protein n=1 Tax=Salvia splendens TaxID=180675 RepID=A0A8X8ZS72_SALSN|nr:hypothetical protein SASPL_123601 [Salvia splendens]
MARSQGQLIDLTVHYFGSTKLMIYIARRSIGYACPTLKSFSLNTSNCKVVLLEVADDAIRLEDILEACPRLESLDVRRCFDLHLEGDLGKRCRERMKQYLKLPHDSVSDVPWPKWDGRDPFGLDAYFYDCAYDYYRDGEDYYETEVNEDDEDENIDVSW